jgi:hypothetical protein
MTGSKKPDERERSLRSCLGRLKELENAGLCKNATNEMAQRTRIDDASKSQYNLEYDYSETTRLANDISEASRSLSINVRKMNENLNSFVSVLEDVQVTAKEEPSLAEKILGWLKYLFKVIARILATVCPLISALLLQSTELKVQKTAVAVSTLGEAAATFCTADPGAFLEHIVLPVPVQVRK